MWRELLGWEGWLDEDGFVGVDWDGVRWPLRAHQARGSKEETRRWRAVMVSSSPGIVLVGWGEDDLVVGGVAP